MTSAATLLAWNWVIESIARFKQVDSSILAGLLKRAPEITDDLGKDAREMVSLRMLESLFLLGNETEVVTDSVITTNISFDPSETCEDALQNILKETSEPLTELEKQKWNVRPFILHKTASLPKSPLQKFKEALLEGRHPHLASLKEMSKLGGAIVSENASPKVDANLNAQNTVDKDDLVSENPAKKNAEIHESLFNSTRGIEDDIGGKEHEGSIEPHDVLGLEENALLNRVKHTPSKIFEQSCDHPNIKHSHEFKNNTLPNVSDGQHSGEGKNSTKNDNQLETGTNSERADDDDYDYDDEMTDIAAKKEAFLSSQCTISQDSMAAFGSTEICVCIKCNEGRQLLVCSSNSCSFIVHQSCLGSAAIFDENGNFFCPFCAYSRAISKYLEVKKKVSLARKDLQVFLSSGVNHIPKTSSKEGASLDLNETRKIRAMSKRLKVNENQHVISRDKEDCAPAGSFHEPMRQANEPKTQPDNKGTPMSDASSNSRRSHKRKPPYTSPKMMLARRKILQWTKPEEDILKEGMKRYLGENNNHNNRGIPWKEILDFGRDVFDKGRMTIDLKDKWRNMCKKPPRN